MSIGEDIQIGDRNLHPRHRSYAAQIGSRLLQLELAHNIYIGAGETKSSVIPEK